MRIEHVAYWVLNLERMQSFFVKYFDARCGNKYVNEKKGFESYFLEFDDGARLELMKKMGIDQKKEIQMLGITHLAISLGSKEKVIELTERLQSDGFEIVDGPRTTGDGYFESVVLDPEGNPLELTI